MRSMLLVGVVLVTGCGLDGSGMDDLPSQTSTQDNAMDGTAAARARGAAGTQPDQSLPQMQAPVSGGNSSTQPAAQTQNNCVEFTAAGTVKASLTVLPADANSSTPAEIQYKGMFLNTVGMNYAAGFDDTGKNVKVSIGPLYESLAKCQMGGPYLTISFTVPESIKAPVARLGNGNPMLSATELNPVVQLHGGRPQDGTLYSQAIGWSMSLQTFNWQTPDGHLKGSLVFDSMNSINTKHGQLNLDFDIAVHY